MPTRCCGMDRETGERCPNMALDGCNYCGIHANSYAPDFVLKAYRPGDSQGSEDSNDGSERDE
jgi:hypothetical protein